MSKTSSVKDILSKISTLTTTIQKLETQESQTLQLIKSNTNTTTNKQQYITINTNKWKCIAQTMKFKKLITNKNVLDTTQRSSATIKAAVQFVKNVDTPSMQQYNLTNPSFDPQRLNDTIIDLKSCGNDVQKDSIMFIKTLQNEWNNNIIIRNGNISTSNDEEKQFQDGINNLINDQLKSFINIYNNLEKQRISLLNAKSNVLISITISHSDILYKLMYGNGQYQQHDILNEVDGMDSIMIEIKQCMKNVVAISNELADEATECRKIGNKQKVIQIEKMLSDIGGKLANLHRALLTMEDIKMDHDISSYLNDKIQVLQQKIDTLENDTESLRDAAKNYIKAEQKNNAKNMLGRRKFCVLQKDEYKRKLMVLQNAMKRINLKDDDGDNENGLNVMNEIETKVMDKDDDMSDVSSVNTDDLDNIVDNKQDDDDDDDDDHNDDDKILDTDYTKWSTEDIILWIIRLKPNDFLKYEVSLKREMSVKNVKGVQLGMMNKNDLQSFGIMNDNDAVYIAKQIEQLVSCYNEDLLDEMYDDDELTGEVL